MYADLLLSSMCIYTSPCTGGAEVESRRFWGVEWHNLYLLYIKYIIPWGCEIGARGVKCLPPQMKPWHVQVFVLCIAYVHSPVYIHQFSPSYSLPLLPPPPPYIHTAKGVSWSGVCRVQRRLELPRSGVYLGENFFRNHNWLWQKQF